MIVRKFMQWVQTAPASQRADGASALARAYLYADLGDEERQEAEQALTGLLDDSSPLVRRALAESFASAADAPHHIILGLADDQSDISSIVLARSPLLTDSELIDCAAIGDTFAQSAIALRPRLSAPVAAAIAEVGGREAAISLAINPGADLPDFSMHRIIERFGDDGEMREALLSRPYLPPALRSDLVAATSKALFTFVTNCNWMPTERAERAAREAREKANVIIAVSSEAEANGPEKLVAHLRGSGQLTAGLVLRALLSGNMSLFEAALCELSGLSISRVRGLLGDWRSAGFAALYRKAGLPEKLLPAFRAALEAMRVCGHDYPGSARLSRQMVERVLTSCENTNDGLTDKLFAVLRRFEAEAAREEARLDTPTFLQEMPNAAPVVVFEHMQEAALPSFEEEPPLLLTDLAEELEVEAPEAETLASEVLEAEELERQDFENQELESQELESQELEAEVLEAEVLDAEVLENQAPLIEIPAAIEPLPSQVIDLDGQGLDNNAAPLIEIPIGIEAKLSFIIDLEAFEAELLAA